jgi:hypothetical protein
MASSIKNEKVYTELRKQGDFKEKAAPHRQRVRCTGLFQRRTQGR